MGGSLRRQPPLAQPHDRARPGTGDARARLLVERCFSGQVVVVPATEPLREIPGDVLHEWGGFLAALMIYRGC